MSSHAECSRTQLKNTAWLRDTHPPHRQTHAHNRHSPTIHTLPQAFKADLAINPGSLPQLLQQYSHHPPDSPGPLQRLMPLVTPPLQQLLGSCSHKHGCDELQALHTLTHQLQQVGAGVLKR